MIATRSPMFIPAATRPFAVARTSDSNSFAVTLCQPSPSARESMMRSGSNHARSDTRFVRFPALAIGTRAGTEISFMCLTLAPLGYFAKEALLDGSLCP